MINWQGRGIELTTLACNGAPSRKVTQNSLRHARSRLEPLKTLFFSNRRLQPLQNPVVTRAAENCTKPDEFPLMPPFAASFLCNVRDMRKIWRKRVGLEFAAQFTKFYIVNECRFFRDKMNWCHVARS
jgi:hypothetical protein